MKSPLITRLSKSTTALSLGFAVILGAFIATTSQPPTPEVLGASTSQRSVVVSGSTYSCTAINCAQH